MTKLAKALGVASVMAACCWLPVTSGWAETWPSRPVTMVAPYAAGGPLDVVGRIVAGRAGEILGQQIVVENITGAGGMVGSKRVADAAPDGYQFVLGTAGSHAQSQTLFAKPLYNASDDFTSVALIARTPIMLVVRNDLPPKTLAEFVAYAKENQGKMSYGSAGIGSASQLACVVLDMAMGTKITHVPYGCTLLAMQDLLAGRVDYLCDIISTAKPQNEAGKVRGLAMQGATRSPMLPNIPTAIEQGVAVEADTWIAAFMPKGVPSDIVNKLNAAIVQALDTPAVKARLEGLGVILPGKDERSPDYLAKLVKSDTLKWEAPIKASGAKID
jgi:tripartite-type tricarboxylate transporter receptor subunit TctC